MHIALHRGDDDFALRAHVAARFREPLLFLFDERNQVRHGLFHDARRFHHLRQEHLALAKQVAHDVHAVHQRPFDHVDRPTACRVYLLARLFGVLDDEVRDAVHERMGQARLDALIAPFEVLFLLRGARLELVGDFEQAIGGVASAIEDDVFHALAQLGIEIGIDAELAGVDDAHVHPGLNRVIEKHGMDRFANRIVAAERERHVRHAAAHLRVGQVLLDPARGIDEIDGVVVVLVDARRDGEDVRIEDDVFGLETDFLDEDSIRARANLRLALERIGLARFVECHDDSRRAVAANEPGVMTECVFAFLERDRVDDGLALHAFEARFDHFPLRGIDHDRHARDVGLGSDEIHKADHRRFRIEHGLVHVDIDDLRAVLDLVARDGKRLVELAVQNHARERLGARDVRAFADVDEERAGGDVKRLEAGKAHHVFGHGSRRWMA